jgi:hypothetical protein
MYYRNPIEIMCTTRLNLQSIGFPLRHPLDYTNQNVFFDFSYTEEYLITHWDCYVRFGVKSMKV